MKPPTGRPARTPGLVLATFLASSSVVGAIALIDFEILPNAPALSYHLTFPEFGFRILSADNSLLTFSGKSRYEPDAGLQPGDTVQEGFVLLDGTLSLQVSAVKEGGIRALTKTIYRLNLKRDALRPANIRNLLVRQRVVRPDQAGIRAGAMRLADARLMRKLERLGKPPHWVRAVRALRNPGRIRFFRSPPDDQLGHFGVAGDDTPNPYVWAVMDRNSQYAIGLTVDRDGDGVANASDNCVGTPNANQIDSDNDAAGDACDLDDDNDGVADPSDNCPLAANSDQRDFDRDGIGDACDFDRDNDAVTDGNDLCLSTSLGEVVDANGCSIADQCPCESDWRNHGAYVKCVARTSEGFLSAGLITAARKDAIVSAGAQSICGIK